MHARSTINVRHKYVKRLFALIPFLIIAMQGCAAQYIYDVPLDSGVLTSALKAEGVQQHSISLKMHISDISGSEIVSTSCKGYKFAFPIIKMLKQTAEILSSPAARDQASTARTMDIRFETISCTAMGDLGEEWPLIKIGINVVSLTKGHVVRDENITSDYKAGGIYGNFNLYGYPNKEQAPKQYALGTYRAIIDVLEKASHDK